jgi:hypothetical protein
MSSIQLITDKALALGLSPHEVSWMSSLTPSSEPSCMIVVDLTLPRQWSRLVSRELDSGSLSGSRSDSSGVVEVCGECKWKVGHCEPVG